MHWEHHNGGEGSGGDMGEAMVQKKVSTWGFTSSTNVCPLKPMRRLQKADTFSYTQRGKACVYLPLGWQGFQHNGA
eukprot:6497141-Ditylum_brightwellii.AAC.1